MLTRLARLASETCRQLAGVARRVPPVLARMAPDGDDLLFAVGLGLASIGLGYIWRPAGAVLFAGVVLLWLFLPARVPFIAGRPRVEE